MTRSISIPGLAIFKILIALSMPIMLAACDGGIIGTGDGEIIDTEGSTPDPVSQTPGTDQESNGSVAFTNNSAATSRQDALIRFVHANARQTDNFVIVVNNDRENPLVPLPGLSYAQATQAYRPITPATASSIQIFLAADLQSGAAQPVAEIDPLMVGAGSVSVVVISTGNTTQSDNVSVLPLAVTPPTTADEVANVRAVYSARAFNTPNGIDIYFRAAGELLVNIDPVFSAISPTTQTVSSYRRVFPGTYELIATQSGEKTPVYTRSGQIEITQGNLLTLIVRDEAFGPVGQAINIIDIDDSIVEN